MQNQIKHLGVHKNEFCSKQSIIQFVLESEREGGGQEREDITVDLKGFLRSLQRKIIFYHVYKRSEHSFRISS